MLLSLIERDDKVADIGTDHGYLLTACLENGISFVQGVENKVGPYNRAKANLADYINQNLAIITLSDGLTSLDSKIDTIVIAGMGGELIANIIAQSLDVAKKMKKMILSPNIKNFELREFLAKNNFFIEKELIVKDGHTYYEVLLVRPSSLCHPLSMTECYFGPYLLKNKNEVFYEKWQLQLYKLKEIINSSHKNLEKIEAQIKLIEGVLND